VRIKGNCLGEHELVLACAGKDARQSLGLIRLRITGKRIYSVPPPPLSLQAAWAWPVCPSRGTAGVSLGTDGPTAPYGLRSRLPPMGWEYSGFIPRM
jgi:hypothetical protein